MKPRWAIGDYVKKRKGSNWHGRVCGYYSTALNPQGYAVESAFEPGSVQIYPEAALEDWDGIADTPTSRSPVFGSGG